MYKRYENITREVLDAIRAGDLIRVNDWTCPMLVKAVPKNSLATTCKKEKDTYCSVCSRLPWNGIRHNVVAGGMFRCGCDNWILETPLGIRYENIYQFNDPELSRLYLQESEDGKAHISERNGVAICDLYIGRYDDQEGYAKWW